MYQKEIKILVIEPKKAITIKSIPNKFHSLQSIVGSYLEVVPLSFPTNLSKYKLVTNEEGKILNLPFNFHYDKTDCITGTVFIVGTDKEGNFTDVDNADVNELISFIKKIIDVKYVAS